MKLKDLKKTHYESTTLLVPDIPRREISLGVNIRAQCFNKTKDLAKVLAARSNIEGAFASTAYYLDPHIKAHTKKGHLGTDLVFDVDAKPVSDRLNWLYDVCFRTSQLVDILVNELGFKKEEMILDFSGNKGFHITIDNPEYKSLSKVDRTQLIHYITGEKVKRADLAFGKGGWNKRFTSYLNNLSCLMKNHSIDNPNANTKTLESLGLPKTTAKKIGDLMKQPTKRELLPKGRLGFLDAKSIASLQSHFFNQQKEGLQLVDKVCTTDMYRIFRIPGTIHPKTGFVSTRLHIDDIDNPAVIIDKVKRAGGLTMTTIDLEKEVTEDFDQVKVWPAGTHEVPRWLALHLLHQ